MGNSSSKSRDGRWELFEFLRGNLGYWQDIFHERYAIGASLVAQMLKNLPAKQETWVESLGLEDPLEKEMATYSSILPWKIPWTEESGRLKSMGSQRDGHGCA